MDLEQRIQTIRQGTPNCTEELFKKQNKICDLCGRPIQDLILAHLDHSIPVIKYAEAWDISLEDAVRECNSLENLRVVHSKCNQVKSFRTREEWFALGLDKKIDDPEFLDERQLNRVRFVAALGGKKGGKKTGPKLMAEGRGIFGLTAEQRKEIGVQNGQRNVNSGWASILGKTYGSIMGQKYAPIQAKKNIESGHIKTLGLKQGKKNVETGHLLRIRTKEVSSKGGIVATHRRWHILRNQKSAKCSLCQGESA